MADEKLNLNASDVRTFVPARDFDLSLRFYTALGWIPKWKADDNKLAILELADCRFFLQDYYVKTWAENFMLQILVEDASAWHTHVSTVLEGGTFHPARVNAPKKEPHGAITTYVWDPAGVLLHFSQFVDD